MAKYEHDRLFRLFVQAIILNRRRTVSEIYVLILLLIFRNFSIIKHKVTYKISKKNIILVLSLAQSHTTFSPLPQVAVYCVSP